MEKISLIIPCYNVENCVSRCLDSIERQTIGIEHLEIILVDDASTDSTLYYLEQFEKKYPEQVIVVVCAENGKLGTARNIGMSYATGKYISFVDSDDVLDLTMLEKMYDKIVEYDCDVVESDFKKFSTENEICLTRTKKDCYIKIDSVETRRKFILGSTKTAVWGRLYKREFLEENGLKFLEKIFYEDCHFSGLAMFLHKSYYFIGETLYYYYQNPNGIIKSKDAKKIQQEIEVEKRLLADLEERGMLKQIQQDYGSEFEFYIICKCYFDALNYIFAHDFENWREMIEYFKNGLLSICPNADQNPYLNITDMQNPSLGVHIDFLKGRETRTEKAFSNSGEKRIILMNTHEYINMGDHLITEATRKLISDYYPDYDIVEVTANHYTREKVLLKQVIKAEDIIVIVGGGYLGSLWLGNGEWNVRSIVDIFQKQKIVIFPQTMYYENSKMGEEELDKTMRVYANHKNLTICLRDKRSYEFAKMIVPSYVTCEYCPETALYLEFDNISKTTRNGCALCLRTDKEKTVSDDEERRIKEVVSGMEFRLGEIDMLSKEVFPIEQRASRVEEKAKEIANYELVITDRLHCMVFCAITHTPCIAINNVTGKVAGVYKWIEQLPYIKMVSDTADLQQLIAQVTSADRELVPSEILKREFRYLAGEICETDINEGKTETYDDEKIVKFIDLAIGNENCNLRCEYCYIAQRRLFNNKLIKIPYELSFLRRAFSKRRFGGRCFINFCAGGETLLAEELLPVIKMLLEEGHYVQIVTNGTVSKAFAEITSWGNELTKRLMFKFSFHYLELLRLNLFEKFWANVKAAQENKISFTVEITPCDNLIPHIPDIQKMCDEKLNGAMPHITVARNDRVPGIDILSEHSVEEYEKIWGVFGSQLFALKMSLYHRKVTEYCCAGRDSLSINLETGNVNQCVAHPYIGNIYADITKPVPCQPVGNNCRLPYCFNGHAYLTFGVCKDIECISYLEVRDRVDRDGNHWVQPEMAEAISKKLYD